MVLNDAPPRDLSSALRESAVVCIPVVVRDTIIVAYLGGNYRTFVGDQKDVERITLDGEKELLHNCRVLVLGDGRLLSGRHSRNGYFGDNDDEPLGNVWDLLVWDPTNMGSYLTVPVITMRGHTVPVLCMAELPGMRAVSGAGGQIFVWNTTTGARVRELHGDRFVGSNNVVCVSGTAEGRVVSMFENSSILVWDANTGECTSRLDGKPLSQKTAMAVMADGRVVIGFAHDLRLLLWTMTNTGHTTLEYTNVGGPHRGCSLRTRSGAGHEACMVTCVLVLGDGRVASGTNDGAVHVWDMTTMQRTQTLRGCHVFPINQLLELPDGRLVSTDREYMLGGRLDRTEREYICLREGFYARNSNMRQQHAAAAYSETMLVWDLSDGSCTTVRADVRYGQVGRFTHVALLPDGSVMCLSEGDPTLRVWR